MASKFETLPDIAVFKICKKLIDQEIDIDDYEELFKSVTEIGTLFRIIVNYEDYSYIKTYLKLNFESIVNNDQSSIEKPSLKVYNVPYYVIETLVERQELVQNFTTYEDDSSNISDIIIELESDDRFDIWSGNENPYRSRDYIDSEFNSWGVRADEIRQIK
jgi:hypothetical protein